MSTMDGMGNLSDQSHQLVTTESNSQDVTGYFLEEVNNSEDMTSDILQLALREASHDTSNVMESSYNPMDDLSVDMVQPRNSIPHDNNRSSPLQQKLAALSQRLNRDLTTLSQCGSDLIMNETPCYFTIENNEVPNPECSTSVGNSISIGLDQLVDSFSNFNANHIEGNVLRQNCKSNNNVSDKPVHDACNSISLSDAQNNVLNDGSQLQILVPVDGKFFSSNLQPSVPESKITGIQNEMEHNQCLPVNSIVSLATSLPLNTIISSSQSALASSVTGTTCIPVLTKIRPAPTLSTPVFLTNTSQAKKLVPVPIQAAPAKIANLTPPLGSSNNPIQVIQHGNTYHSTQTLTNEQLQQIALVLQQQQQQDPVQINENGGAVLYSPDTNTRIIYRVVYPSNLQNDLNTKEGSSDRNLKITTSNKSKSRPRKTWSRRVELDLPRAEGQELSKEEKDEKKKHRPRTRYGRISKPPSYMIKDYKRIHHLDFDEEPYDDSDGGYSDFKQSEDEGDSNQEPRNMNNRSNVANGSNEKESKKSLPPGVTTIKPRNYKCPTCEKAYIGKGGLERHFRISPGHGSIEDFEEHAQEANYSDDNSNISASSHASNYENAKNSNNSNISNSIETLSKDNVTTTSQNDAVNPSKNKHSRFSAAYYARRKTKLKELVQPYQDEELLELLLPRLAKLVNLWDFLLLKSEKGDPAEPDVADIFQQFDELVKRLQTLAKDCLVMSSLNVPNCQSSSEKHENKDSDSLDVNKLFVEITSERVAYALGISAGIYEVKQKELVEFVPSFIKSPRKRKRKDGSEGLENDDFSVNKTKKSCSKTNIIVEDESNSSQGLNFITSTSMMNNSGDSLGDLSIPETILTHPVPMIGEQNIDLAQLTSNISVSCVGSNSSINNKSITFTSTKDLKSRRIPGNTLGRIQNPKVQSKSILICNNTNTTDTNHSPMCSSSISEPSNAAIPTISMENSLLYNNLSLSPSSLDLKSLSSFFQVKKVSLFGSPEERDTFLTLENSEDSLTGTLSRTLAKDSNLGGNNTLTRVKEMETNMHDSECTTKSDINEATIPKSSSSNMSSCIISQTDTAALFEQANRIPQEDTVNLFKSDNPGNDTGSSILMSLCSKSDSASPNDFQEIVVDLEETDESNNNNNSCLVGLLVNSNEEKLKVNIDDSTLNQLDLVDMNEEVSSMFEEKHTSEREIEKHDDIENSFLPGNVIIVQNPDGTTTLQVPGNQVFSLEALQALLGFEQASSLSGSNANLGNSVTLNPQLTDISGQEHVLLENLQN